MMKTKEMADQVLKNVYLKAVFVLGVIGTLSGGWYKLTSIQEDIAEATSLKAEMAEQLTENRVFKAEIKSDISIIKNDIAYIKGTKIETTLMYEEFDQFRKRFETTLMRDSADLDLLWQEILWIEEQLGLE